MPPVPRILLFSGGPAADDLHGVLDQAGYDIAARPLGQPANGPPASLLIIDGAHEAEQALRLCHRLRTEQTEQFVPILYVAADADVQARRACLECGADSYLVPPFDPAELLAQVQALL